MFYLTGGYLITQKDVFFDRSRASQLIASILACNDQDIRIDLPPPAIFKVSNNTFYALRKYTYIFIKKIWNYLK